MSAEDFNKDKLASGDLTGSHLVKLVELWQRIHGLVVDGYAGENTIESLSEGDELEKFFPLACLEDGRKPQITSGFYTENASRPTHKGVDFFYPWLDSDPDVPVGDGGAVMRNGKRRWWYPSGAVARAAADGVVQQASEIGTGCRVWVDHGNGERTGYFHGSSLLVQVGQEVLAGCPLIVVGDNPKGHDAKHLHFEVSPVGRYAPMNPRTWLRGAKYL
jgi:murein DD-endopeptidase MepM/ murein hydrolase activator NlpD